MRYSNRIAQGALLCMAAWQLSSMARADGEPALAQAQGPLVLALQSESDRQPSEDSAGTRSETDPAQSESASSGPSFSDPGVRIPRDADNRAGGASSVQTDRETGRQPPRLQQPGSSQRLRSSQPSSSRRVRPGVELEERSPGTGNAEPATDTRGSTGKSRIMEAYRKSKTANDVQALTEIIDLCRDGMQDSEGLKKDTIAYARKLMAWAYNRRGEVRAAAGDDEPALEDFQAAVDLDSTLWRAIHNRGVSYATLGKYNEAIADFDETIRLRPSYPNAYFNRGEVRYEQADYNAAINDYDQAVRLAPRDAANYNSRGHAYYRLNQFRRALDDYNTAVRLEPQKAAAYVNRGDAYADLGLYPQAERDYRNGVRLDPKSGRALQSGAWLMATCPDQRYRNPELALEWAQQAIELDGDGDHRYLETLAAAWANAGKFDEARRAQAQAIRAAPPEQIDRNRERLELYERRAPYREAARQQPPAGEMPQRTRRNRF